MTIEGEYHVQATPRGPYPPLPFHLRVLKWIGLALAAWVVIALPIWLISSLRSSGNESDPVGNTQSCRFLAAARADFETPNPGPTTPAEQTEYDAILAQMATEGC